MATEFAWRGIPNSNIKTKTKAKKKTKTKTMKKKKPNYCFYFFCISFLHIFYIPSLQMEFILGGK